jgi:hypothetical protein
MIHFTFTNLHDLFIGSLRYIKIRGIGYFACIGIWQTLETKIYLVSSI